MIFQNIKKNIVFIKYAIVWVTSTLVDMWSLYFFVDVCNFNLYVSVIAAFLLAVINGFVWNKFWTFEDKSKKYKRQFVKFFIVSVIGLFLTLLLMYIFVDIFHIHYLISKALTSIIVLFWNYFWNKLWTFQSGNEEIEIKPTKETFEIKYSIIVPAYNEEKRIIETLQKAKDYFDQKGDKYEIIVVNDGSKDNTVGIVSKFSKDIRIVENPQNMGKGYSIKNWVFHAVGEYILFIDADNSTPIDNFSKLEKHVDKYDVVIGSRHMKESEIGKKQPWYRRMVGRLWNKLINLILIKGIKDTQCGFKLFKYNSAVNIFPYQKINRFGFDMEILFISKIRGYSIKEVPVSWFNDEWSRLHPIKDSLKTLGELLYIKLNHIFDGYK